MPNLKHLRNRIASIKSTQKITSAMKMLSSVKLRRAQKLVVEARPYAHSMHYLLCNLLEHSIDNEVKPALLTGHPDINTHLIIVITGDRGLCGSFNASIVKTARKLIQRLEKSGQKVILFTIGKKAYNSLKSLGPDYFLDSLFDIEKDGITYEKAQEISTKINDVLESKKIGAASLVYSVFKSPIIQKVTIRPLVPFDPTLYWTTEDTIKEAEKIHFGYTAHNKQEPFHLYEFEPNQEKLLKELFPRNLAVQIYQSLLENQASEFGARMTAMDNATRNAQDVIQKLQLTYNRSRQAYITNELIEIISGAEAL